MRNCQTAFSGACTGRRPCPPIRALSPSSVGQSREDFSFAVCVVISGSENTVINLLQVGDSQAEFPGRRNVPRLPEKQILGGIVKEDVAVGGDAGRIVLPQR